MTRILIVTALVAAPLLGAACTPRAPAGTEPTRLAATDGAGRSVPADPARRTRWETAEHAGVRWLVTPEGRRFYSTGVNTVNGAVASAKSARHEAYYWGNFFPTPADWRAHTRRRILAWGFNTIGAWSDPSPALALPYTVELDLGRRAKLHWVDPFDPAMEAATTRMAEALTRPYRGDPRRLGYFTDNEVGWWNGPLFRWYLDQGWHNHTKRALWQLLHDHYGGSWAALARDWIPQGALRSFADLRAAGASLKLRPGGRGIEVVNRFTHLCARRYYALVHQALRQVDPEALILGDRLPLYYNQDAVLAAADLVDVLSTNYDADLPDGWVAPYYFEGLERLSGKPVLVSEFFFAADENRSGNLNVGHLMTVATQRERARGTARAVRNFARFPNVVGAHWFQYYDHPRGGRESDGEDYNMGLVDTADRPYAALADVFARLNPRLARLHGRSRSAEASRHRTAAEAGVVAIARAPAPIDVADRSLRDWHMARTRLTGLLTAAPYVPFGDVHLAWAPDGLYLASLASNYLDVDLLAPGAPFPLAETFQLHLVVERDGRRHHLAVHLEPRLSRRLRGRLVVEPRLYRYRGTRSPRAVPVAGHVQGLGRPLPHVAFEAFVPARWLGGRRLAAGTRLGLNVVVVGYFGERTMSWAGTPAQSPTAALLRTLRPVVLADRRSPA